MPSGRHGQNFPARGVLARNLRARRGHLPDTGLQLQFRRLNLESKTTGLLFALAVSGCGGAAEIPATPDLASLIRSYDAPDGELDETRAAEVLADAPPMPELAAGIRSTGIVADDVNAASSDTSPKKGSGIKLQGSVQINARCPGELTDANYDPAVNGSLSLTVAVADTRIRRTIGGHADSCVLKGYVGTKSVRVELDGNLAFDLGHDIGIGQRWSGQLLAYLPGKLEVEGYTFQSISARFTADRVEHLIRLADGTAVVVIFTDTGLTVRDRDGAWVCPSGGTCTRQ